VVPRGFTSFESPDWTHWLSMNKRVLAPVFRKARRGQFDLLGGWEPVMARYYFNLLSRNEKILDDRGVEIPLDCEPLIPSIVREVLAEDPELLHLGQGWCIEVLDGENRTVAKFHPGSADP
jgi:hypothetical protein